MNQRSQKYPVNIPFRMATFAYLGFGVLFVLAQSHFGSWHNAQSLLSITPWIPLLGVGISVLIIGTVYGYFSWSLNADAFKEWYIDQVIIGKTWANITYGPAGLNLWLFRLVGSPICCLAGVLIAGFSLRGIVNSF